MKNRKIVGYSVLILSTLKYSRLKGKALEILAKDTASAIAVSSRVIVSRNTLTAIDDRPLEHITEWSMCSHTKDPRSTLSGLMLLV
jgi:hypothetical protein